MLYKERLRSGQETACNEEAFQARGARSVHGTETRMKATQRVRGCGQVAAGSEEVAHFLVAVLYTI